MTTRSPTGVLSIVIAVLAGAVDAVIVTLLVAWALEDVIYFSLFVGIPAGMVSGVITSVLLGRYLTRTRKEPT